MLPINIAPIWSELLSEESRKDYIQNIFHFLEEESAIGKLICPDRASIFRALELVDYQSVKVVILGQDPYPGKGHANGLAFAVHENVAIPPSLANIFKEVENDLGRPAMDRTLLSWTRQGVLLLNTVLTTRQGEAYSHRGKGWEIFTDAVISLLGKKETPTVFLLWGSAAQSKAKLISGKQHFVFTAPHPSPLSVYRGFAGCRHFSKANEALLDSGMTPINWATKQVAT